MLSGDPWRLENGLDPQLAFTNGFDEGLYEQLPATGPAGAHRPLPLNVALPLVEEIYSRSLETFYDDFSAHMHRPGLRFLRGWQRVVRFGATALSIATILTLLGLAFGTRRTRLGVLLFGVGGLTLLIAPVADGQLLGALHGADGGTARRRGRDRDRRHHQGSPLAPRRRSTHLVSAADVADGGAATRASPPPPRRGVASPCRPRISPGSARSAARSCSHSRAGSSRRSWRSSTRSRSHDVFSLWRTTVLPEPLEETRSILALGTPFVVAAAIIAFGTPGAPSRSLNRLIVPAQAAAIVLLVAAVLKQPRQSGFLIDYFQPYLLSVPNLVAGVVIGILLTVGTLRWSGRVPEAISRSASRLSGSSALPLGIAVIATAVFLLPAVVTDATRRARRSARLRSHPGAGGGLPGGGQWAHSARRLHRPVRQPAAAPPRADPEDVPLFADLGLDRPLHAVGDRAARRSSESSGWSPGGPGPRSRCFCRSSRWPCSPGTTTVPTATSTPTTTGSSRAGCWGRSCSPGSARFPPAAGSRPGRCSASPAWWRSTTSSSACRPCSACSPRRRWAPSAPCRIRDGSGASRSRPPPGCSAPW